MEKKYHTITCVRLLGTGFILMVLFCSYLGLFGSQSHAGEESERMESALIKQKSQDGIIIDGQKYRLTESTLIFDPLGKEIPICDLPVPCKAIVEYRQSKNTEPIVLRIEVRQLLEGSDNKD